MSQFDIDLDDHLREDNPFSFNSDEWVGPRYGVWRTNEGDLIKFRDMKTSHLQNTKAFIERSEADYEFSRVYRGICRELKRRTKENQ